MSHPAVSIVIPAYNEAAVIGNTIERVIKMYPDYEVLVVNDGSTDETASVALQAGARVYNHPYNIGNGAAVKNGIRQAKGDYVLLMDGDGQHDPKDIARLVTASEKYDLVVGARQRGSQASVGRSVANKIYNGLARYVTRFPIEDLTSGLRIFKRETVMHFLYLFPNSFSYPTTSTLSYLRSGLTLKYIPIDAAPRVGKSKIKIVRDGVRFLLLIMKITTLYSPLRVFIPVSAAFFITGFGYYLYTYISFSRFTNMSALMLSTGVMVFLLGLVSEQITQTRYDRVEF